MATIYGKFRYGEAVYGIRQPVAPTLPPPTHIGGLREDVADLNRPIEQPAVTLPREQQVNPHREGLSE